jgi:hypothetical protein
VRDGIVTTPAPPSTNTSVRRDPTARPDQTFPRLVPREPTPVWITMELLAIVLTVQLAVTVMVGIQKLDYLYSMSQKLEVHFITFKIFCGAISF